MRRPVLMAVLLAIALFSVIYGKYRLDQSIKEGRFNTDPPAQSTAGKTMGGTGQQPAGSLGDAKGSQHAPLGTTGDGTSQAADLSPAAKAAAAHNQVMAALVEARQSFRLRDKVSGEAAADPHTTPNTILRSAEVLGALISLEQSHPESQADFQAFYLECVQDPRVITITRTQCLEKYIISKRPSPDETKALIANTDPVVAKLYLEMQP